MERRCYMVGKREWLIGRINTLLGMIDSIVPSDLNANNQGKTPARWASVSTSVSSFLAGRTSSSASACFFKVCAPLDFLFGTSESAGDKVSSKVRRNHSRWET